MKKVMKAISDFRSASSTKEVRKIKILSAGKIFAVFGILIGLSYGIMALVASFYTPASLADSISQLQSGQNSQQAIFNFLVALKWFALIVAPLFVGVAQFIYGVFLAVVYNLFARFVGGVKIELR